MSFTNEWSRSTNKHQWQEKRETPYTGNNYTKQQFMDFLEALAIFHECEVKDIIKKFKKITNENDEDRDDCVCVELYVQRIVDNRVVPRLVFSSKIAIPPELQEQIEKKKRDRISKTVAIDLK